MNIFQNNKNTVLMKKTKIIYWTFTGLFALLMLFSAIPDALCVPDAITFMTHLGYPKYIISFLGIAKILGVIALLVPGYPRIKEWAYAGLAFDLIGAIYSTIVVGPVSFQMIFMLVWIVPGTISYVYYHKLQNAA